MTTDTEKELQGLPSDANNHFRKIFQVAKTLCEKLGVVMNIPRMTIKQKYRSNSSILVPEDYYRVTIYIPYIGLFISELEHRFRTKTCYN
ncbi:UNVERIFIED_CONTAM: hypothetical protein RMT77_013744 [Armadillidium vulgare]